VALAANGDTVKVGEEHTGTKYTLIENTTPGTQEAGFVGKASGVGVLGESVNGTGVIGRSTAHAGVQGFSIDDAGVNGFGVFGVWAHGSSFGVTGVSFAGQGVHGEAETGVGGYFTATTGTALQVAGKATFSRSGRATVLKGKPYADVDLRTKGGLSGTPLCFANLMSYRTGVYVAAVRPNYPSTGKLRIYLNKAVTSSTDVAYFVAN